MDMPTIQRDRSFEDFVNGLLTNTIIKVQEELGTTITEESIAEIVNVRTPLKGRKAKESIREALKKLIEYYKDKKFDCIYATKLLHPKVLKLLGKKGFIDSREEGLLVLKL